MKLTVALDLKYDTLSDVLNHHLTFLLLLLIAITICPSLW
jgi:hypothetical protein